MSVVARPPEWTYLGCGNCGVYFVDPMPSGDAVPDAGEFYDETYYSGAPRAREDEWDALTARAWRAQVKAFTDLAGTTGRLLDVGCGTGKLLAAARDVGWDVEGVEVSSAADYARSVLGLKVFTGTLEGAGHPDASFDAVWLSHVVEHVPDPVALLREVVRVLKPGGYAKISVPNSGGFVYAATNLVHRLRGRYGKDKFTSSLSPPGHLYAFNEKSLRVALAKVSLAPVKVFTAGKGDPVYFPILTWQGSGKWSQALRAAEWVGRHSGRGTLIECIARR
ncbi:MAG: class I SAM-dependent methyltransferase [Actinomycetota bacterium]